MKVRTVNRIAFMDKAFFVDRMVESIRFLIGKAYNRLRQICAKQADARIRYIRS